MQKLPAKETPAVPRTRRSQRPACATVILLLVLLAAPAALQAAPEDDPELLAAWRALAEPGGGFVVWESSRTGAWRIWHRSLDGTDLRQLTPDEKGRQHYCPHVSPDGTRVAYLSYPSGADTYGNSPKPDTKAPLYVIDVAGGQPRMVAENARAYFEDRAVVWLTPDELVYIDGTLATRRLDLRTGESSVLVEGDGAWLVNVTGTFATSGWATFSRYDPDSRRVTETKRLGGCQPYFSRDGVWGFWMYMGGGPINRIRLADRSVSPIIAKNDPRMPRDRAYLYFPMLSPCQRRFAFAASPGQHDHFGADYDIFVAACDPKTLELVGRPVRYSFDKGCDRFPDVFLADLPLGHHAGEAPFTVDLSAPGQDGTWKWEFGDGATAEGRTARHTFAEPGTYAVRASRGDRVLKGEVRVEPARPPHVTGAFVQDGVHIHVTFDEPVDAGGARLSMDSGTRIAGYTAGEDGRGLVVALERKLAKPDVLILEGIADRAQRPNTMAPTRVDVKPSAWPRGRDGLVFLWEAGDRPNEVAGIPDGKPRACNVKRRGLARLDHDYRLLLSGGAAVTDDATGLLEACKASNRLTVEALVLPDNHEQGGPARIVSFSTDSGLRNFTLGQEKDKLIFRLRTPATGNNGTNPQTELCPVRLDAPSHVVVTYEPGRLVCYLNGEPVLNTDRVKGDFSNWTPQHLVMGDEHNGERDWRGTLESVAIYSRVLAADEAAANARQRLAMLAARADVPATRIKARLLAKSEIPTLEKINPYREALVVFEYEAVQAPEGSSADGRIRVVHWGMLDGKTLPVAERQPGKVFDLDLEAFDANRQLESVFRSDTLDLDLDRELLFDTGSP